MSCVVCGCRSDVDVCDQCREREEMERDEEFLNDHSYYDSPFG